MTIPDYAIGENGKPAIMMSPVVETADHALPPLVDNVVKDLPIFRTGKVKDSKGRSHTWTRNDLDAMVTNFSALKASGTFPNVPVRANHSRDVNQVGGYYLDVRRKGNILYADIEFTEPDMRAKYERKTFRSRSIEIGAYESNDGAVTFPAVMGLAFCDIPAVEGLFSAAVKTYESEGDREVLLFAGEEPDGTSSSGAAGAAGVAEGSLSAVIVGLHALAGQYATDPDAHDAVMQIIQAVQAVQSPAAGDQQTKTAATKAGSVDTFKFSLDGGKTEIDVAGDDGTKAALSYFATQTATLTEQLTALTAERTAEKKAARETAVDTWLHSSKILPAQVEAMKAYVATLTDDQFTAHEALVTAAPGAPILQDHSGGSEGEQIGEEQKIAEARQTYSMLTKSGVTGEKLKQTAAARFLASKNIDPEA